jgi:hypothetical protein
MGKLDEFFAYHFSDIFTFLFTYFHLISDTRSVVIAVVAVVMMVVVVVVVAAAAAVVVVVLWQFIITIKNFFYILRF